jgi:hypothetical protein
MSFFELFSLMVFAWGIGGIFYNCILLNASSIKEGDFFFYQGWALTVAFFGLMMFTSFNLGEAKSQKSQATEVVQERGVFQHDEAAKTAEKE